MLKQKAKSVVRQIDASFSMEAEEAGDQAGNYMVGSRDCGLADKRICPAA